MAINDVYRVSMFWDIVGNDGLMQSSIHYAQRGAAAMSMADVGDKHKTFWNGIRAHYPTTTELEKITLRRIDPIEVFEQEYITGLPIAGTGAGGGDSLPAGTAFLVTLRTNSVGRSFRGRMYLPPFSEGELDGVSQWDSASTSDVANELETLFSDMASLGDLYDPVVWSPTLGVGTNITTVFGDRWPRSQRRRANVAGQYVT